jgi:hypothetical protein
MENGQRTVVPPAEVFEMSDSPTLLAPLLTDSKLTRPRTILLNLTLQRNPNSLTLLLTFRRNIPSLPNLQRKVRVALFSSALDEGSELDDGAYERERRWSSGRRGGAV